MVGCRQAGLRRKRLRCYHARLRVGRYIRRGRRPALNTGGHRSLRRGGAKGLSVNNLRPLPTRGDPVGILWGSQIPWRTQPDTNAGMRRCPAPTVCAFVRGDRGERRKVVIRARASDGKERGRGVEPRPFHRLRRCASRRWDQPPPSLAASWPSRSDCALMTL